MQRLAEQSIIVTAAASGIGRAVALRCAAEGAFVSAIDRNEEGLQQTAELIRAQGGTLQTIVCDVTKPDQVESAVKQAAEWQGGRLDGLFNGVGLSGRRWGDGPVDICSEEGWDYVLNNNLKSMFLVCKYAVPWLLKTRGAIVNLSSVLGIVGGDADFATHAYAASKAGIIGLSRSMAAYYANQGLRVNVVAPGLIATPMSQRAQNDPHIQERLSDLQPLTGQMGQPEDIAGAVVYLLSCDARFVTGVVLPVDGGWTVK